VVPQPNEGALEAAGAFEAPKSNLNILPYFQPVSYTHVVVSEQC
jgi:hypothetical protein